MTPDPPHGSSASPRPPARIPEVLYAITLLPLLPLAIEVAFSDHNSKGVLDGIVRLVKPYPYGSEHADVMGFTLLLLPFCIAAPRMTFLWPRFRIAVAALAGIWLMLLAQVSFGRESGVEFWGWIAILVVYVAALAASLAIVQVLSSLGRALWQRHLWRVPGGVARAVTMVAGACLVAGLAVVARQGSTACAGSLVSQPVRHPGDCTSLPIRERVERDSPARDHLGPFRLRSPELPGGLFEGWLPPAALELPRACTHDTTPLLEPPAYGDSDGGLHGDTVHARWLVTGYALRSSCPILPSGEANRHVIAAFRVEPPGPLRSLPRYRLSLALTALAALTLAYVARQLRRSPSAEGTSAATSESGEGLTEGQRAVRRAVAGLLVVALLMTLGACAFVAALPS